MRNEKLSQLGLYISSTIFASLVSAAVVGFFLLATSPRDIGGLGVTLWFIALFVFITCSICLIRYIILRRSYPELQTRLLLFRRCFRFGLIAGLFLTVALAMQSLRMLSFTDVLLFLMTIGIIELYFRTKRQ